MVDSRVSVSHDARLYTEFARWWHVLSPPEEYADAAAFYWDTITTAGGVPPAVLLELGSGGGNNAFHMKAHCRLTLVDRSSAMLEQSRTINPECEHVAGDLRSLRLGRVFDAVFVQDAVSYMLSLSDLEAAIQTAFVHCRPGGVALFAPDWVRESFRGTTSHCGGDAEGLSIRCLEWAWDPDPADSTYVMDLVFGLRNESGVLRLETERHRLGAFPRADWLRILRDVGFEPQVARFPLAGDGPGAEVFVGLRPVA